MGTGFYEGIKITVCSTGIGASSTEIAVVQLIALGAKALIRIGGTGVIREDILRDYGAQHGGGPYGRSLLLLRAAEYPAVASFEVLDCLKRSCEEQKKPYAMGICVSVGSFYHGQGRKLPFEGEYDEQAVLERYGTWNIVNMEMERRPFLHWHL